MQKVARDATEMPEDLLYDCATVIFRSLGKRHPQIRHGSAAVLSVQDVPDEPELLPGSLSFNRGFSFERFLEPKEKSFSGELEELPPTRFQQADPGGRI